MSKSTIPAELAEVIALHRELFAGFEMMADTEGTDGAAQPDSEPVGDGKEPEADATDWKSEARKWEDRAKANKAAADELAQLKDSQKTEEQKRDEEFQQLRSELESYKTREQIAAWAKEVADAEKVPAELLRGSTREELEAHAKQLKPLITAAPPKAEPVPGIGQVPEARNMPLKDQIAAAEKAGDKALVASLKAMQLAQTPASS